MEDDFADNSVVGKSWRFTLNNWTDEEFESCKLWAYTRIIIGKEIAPTTGTPHLQGSVVFKSAKRLKGLKKLNNRISWKPANFPNASFNYCKKDGDYWEDDRREQGARHDIIKAKELFKTGASVHEIALEVDSYQAARMGELLVRTAPFRSVAIQREILWFYGPTGTGKSATAREAYPDLYLKDSYKWWDGYNGEETVLIDDMRADFCKFHELLKLLDRYTYRGEIKGGSIPITAKRFIVTSPYAPEDLYKGRTDEDIAQLLRRITEVRNFVTTVVTVTEVGGNTRPRPRLQTEPETFQPTSSTTGVSTMPPAAARALASATSRYFAHVDSD